MDLTAVGLGTVIGSGWRLGAERATAERELTAETAQRSATEVEGEQVTARTRGLGRMHAAL